MKERHPMKDTKQLTRTLAGRIILPWLGNLPAVQTRAPHAYRGTPPRPHWPRAKRARLFKGHRP